MYKPIRKYQLIAYFEFCEKRGFSQALGGIIKQAGESCDYDKIIEI